MPANLETHNIRSYLKNQWIDKACHTMTSITHFVTSILKVHQADGSLSPGPDLGSEECSRMGARGHTVTWACLKIGTPNLMICPHSPIFSLFQCPFWRGPSFRGKSHVANRMPLSKLNGLLPRRRTTWIGLLYRP